MGSSCHCGSRTGHVADIGCLECGTACCPSCAVQLESASYCQACASALLGVPAVSPGTFELR